MDRPSAPRTARDFARIELTRAIRAEGRRQLAEVGPGQLSLRAVARELGMASSAVYRYFPSRDHLITALLIEAYDESGVAVQEADAAVARDRFRRRWIAMTSALRAWALANHHEYALLYGSPVPGYAAPEDTVAPAQRVTLALLTLFTEAHDAGERPSIPGRPVPRKVSASLAPIAELAPMPGPTLIRGLLAWSTVIGQLSLELFGHLHKGVLDYQVHWDHLMEQLADDLGLK
ncbi:MAG TPA: TetR/AcrR family transcriptional regulator [Marmoricola sp.]|jgi:AcrR family transcriptional regulator|nr:TetR/AcrR family transcriptional regulator [Marmoricola sp.]